MPFNIPASSRCRSRSPGARSADWTLSFKIEVVLLGGGALMSFRTGWSLLLGGLLTYARPRALARRRGHRRAR